ncbi:MAG: cytidylate kinase-like family protein [Chloroflexi bacterium]|nr:cytidylate kinase-like family protein [Chloroflexota bacterium]
MIITIARQLGSGGAQVGQLVARRLNIPYLDRHILQRVAQQAELSEEAIEDSDERRPTLLERMAGFTIQALPFSESSEEYPLPGENAAYESEYDAHRYLMESTILEIARQGSAVIAGRGGQVVLREHREALHVFIQAPDAVRVERVARSDGISLEEARRKVEASDRNRAGYLRVGYRVDWRDPRLYDLAINTARIGPEEAADLIVRFAQAVSAGSGIPSYRTSTMAEVPMDHSPPAEAR